MPARYFMCKKAGKKFPFDDTSQVLFYFYYSLNVKKDRMMFMLTHVTKWKTPTYISTYALILLL